MGGMGKLQLSWLSSGKKKKKKNRTNFARFFRQDTK